jgi:hypothetical protein
LPKGLVSGGRRLGPVAGSVREGSGLDGQQAVDASDVAPLSPAQIDVEVRLVTAVLDGIGLQWLLDPSTDVVESISTYVDRAVLGWRSSR